MQSRTYEITFAGQAGATVRAEFDDCEVSVGPGTTTLRAVMLDQGALQGLMQRISGLGLELIEVRVVAPPAGGDRAGMAGYRVEHGAGAVPGAPGSAPCP